MISTESTLWHYLTLEEQGLVRDGYLLIEDRRQHPNEKLSDHSYLVFPFAKLYEGFLKQLFLDLHVISQGDYASDHFRIGKTLSPNMAERLGHRSAYIQIEHRYGEALAQLLWQTWKQARNLVFHYFPHNYRALNFDQAQELIEDITNTMEQAVLETRVQPVFHKDVIQYGRYQATP